jgi:hypothetical protein
MNSALLYVPLPLAQKPISGDCVVDQWWIVHPKQGVTYSAVLTGKWTSTMPHIFCRDNEEDCRVLQENMFPDHQVMKIPVVYNEHATLFMRQVQKNVQTQEEENSGVKKKRKPKTTLEGVNGTA